MSTTSTTQTQATRAFKPKTGFAGFFETLVRFVRGKPLGAFGALIIGVMVLFAVAAPLISPYDPNAIARRERLQPPSARHLLGTDFAGRDIFSRVMYGAQVSVAIGFGAIFISTALASGLGMLSAFKAGKTDILLQRFVDATMAIPTLVLLLGAAFVLDRGGTTLTLLLGFLFGVRSSRVVRGAALSIMQNEYITGARAIGATDSRLILVHILPNIFAPIMVLATVQLGAVILLEASLSFLNLGVPPPAVSWGNMLALTGLPFMAEAPWMVLAPGLTITLAVYGVNMLGDALRDVLDPRLRRGGQNI